MDANAHDVAIEKIKADASIRVARIEAEARVKVALEETKQMKYAYEIQKLRRNPSQTWSRERAQERSHERSQTQIRRMSREVSLPDLSKLKSDVEAIDDAEVILGGMLGGVWESSWIIPEIVKVLYVVAKSVQSSL